MARLSGRAPNCGSYPSPKPTKKAAPMLPGDRHGLRGFPQFLVRSGAGRQNPGARRTRLRYAVAVLILIVLGLASSRLGKVKVSTPFLYWALAFSASTELGSG